jgi:hypothetical protein
VAAFLPTSGELFVSAAPRHFAAVANLAEHSHVAMPPLPARMWFVCVLSFACAVSLQAQGSVAPPPTATALKLDYPDSTAGLEHLVKDIIKAQKENAGDRADALLQSLVLPQPRAWYDMAFGTSVAEESKSIYEQSSASIPNSMAQFLLRAVSNGMNDVVVVRFEKSCDDNSGEDVFGILEARRQPIHFTNGV